MCTVTAALVAMGASTALSTGAAFVGQRQQNQAAEAAAEHNRTLAETAAEDVLSRGVEEAGRHRAGVSGLIGRQKATVAGSNVLVGTGSAGAIVEETQFLGTMDAMTITFNAAREAERLRTLAANEQAITTSPFLAAGTNLLSGAANFGAAYLDFNPLKKKKGIV